MITVVIDYPWKMCFVKIVIPYNMPRVFAVNFVITEESFTLHDCIRLCRRLK